MKPLTFEEIPGVCHFSTHTSADSCCSSGDPTLKENMVYVYFLLQIKHTLEWHLDKTCSISGWNGFRNFHRFSHLFFIQCSRMDILLSLFAFEHAPPLIWRWHLVMHLILAKVEFEPGISWLLTTTLTIMPLSQLCS